MQAGLMSSYVERISISVTSSTSRRETSAATTSLSGGEGGGAPSSSVTSSSSSRGGGGVAAAPSTGSSSPVFINSYVGMVIMAYTVMVLAFFGLTVLGEVTMRTITVLTLVVAVAGLMALVMKYLPAWIRMHSSSRRLRMLSSPPSLWATHHHPHHQGARRRGEGTTSLLVSGLNVARLQLLIADRDFDGNDYEILRALDDDNDAVFQGATPTEINRLPIHVVSANEKKSRSCPVCLDYYTTGDRLRTLPCLHQFHQACIDEWLGRKADCPVCKFSAFG